MKRLPYEVLEVDVDGDPIASWGHYDNLPEARVALDEVLQDHPANRDRGFVIRCNGQAVAICPTLGPDEV